MLEIAIGDIVKLKEPYLAEEKEPYQFGIVVEKLSESAFSLHLFNSKGKLYIYPYYKRKGLMIPTYVDFNVSELSLYKKATHPGYHALS